MKKAGGTLLSIALATAYWGVLGNVDVSGPAPNLGGVVAFGFACISGMVWARTFW